MSDSTLIFLGAVGAPLGFLALVGIWSELKAFHRRGRARVARYEKGREGE